ncbi:parallel beta-helix domain-containing protein [Altererythrobacter arenosus]|uniref:Parallel beta-helix domain-containing protein n=1 Tax=Altererythrobacter arenosus TaxID=3032592 RepID=A0ABY8FSA6_9SPHN|nr:parallel beta-helix domain-containing protein [Altererythrobacter sp. CAU 1644]WFL77888.1 parallel beta-helix domain-containing protein [Altererythrobacter sp. CAU 1644]
MLTTAATIAALAASASALAETHNVAPGEGAQERLQEALILAEPGDEIVLGAGRFTLTDGLSLDVDGVTVRGAGMDASVLDFTAQQDAGEGLLVTSDNVTLRDFGIDNPKGDGIKSKGADNIVYHKIRVTWTAGPRSSNGAYAIYPVESTGVLVDSVVVSGASDAGIYVGQSKDITVRNSIAQYNVAGIEIENSRNAVVESNLAIHNTGGILVFDLPGLPVMGGGDVVVRNNLVATNDVDNFAPPGNIVGGVRRGTGILVMANDNVLIEGNVLSDNDTAQVMVVSYTQSYDDERYNPYPRGVVVGQNHYVRGGARPDLAGSDMLIAAFGGALPAVMWDGLGDGATPALLVVEGTPGWSLNLPQLGASDADAQPGPLEVPLGDNSGAAKVTGAPEALSQRI